MAHQASYRVYRPRRFSEVEGQSRTVDTLKEAVRQGRLTHAYLFSGPRGTGKTSVARILAKAVNCENLQESGDPCLECASCRNIESGQHLDVIEIDAASNRGIDEMREIKERISHQTAMSRYKVYIIDEVHMLTAEAFNALLKTLEEPPSYVLFILATTEAHKLPITVLSRCQRYEFKRLSVAVIQKRLRYVAQQEQVSYEEAALEVLSEAADGALRDALSLFDQVVATEGELRADGVARVAGMISQADMHRLLSAFVEGVQPLVHELADLRSAGLDEKLILRDLARELRDLLVFRSAGKENFPSYRHAALESVHALFPSDLPVQFWVEAIEALAQAEVRLKGGFPADLAVELAILQVQQKLVSGHAPPAIAESGSHAPQHRRGASSSISQRSDEPPKREEELLPKPMNPDSSLVQRRIAVDEETIKTKAEPLPSGEFQQILDIVKRERPSTYALFEKTQGLVGSDGMLTVWFEFPAHREIMNQPNNREVVERAIRSVYGPSMPYQFVVGKPLQEEGAGGENASASIRQKVRDWFGNDVKMVGFGEDIERVNEDEF